MSTTTNQKDVQQEIEIAERYVRDVVVQFCKWFDPSRRPSGSESDEIQKWAEDATYQFHQKFMGRLAPDILCKIRNSLYDRLVAWSFEWDINERELKSMLRDAGDMLLDAPENLENQSGIEQHRGFQILVHISRKPT